MTWADHRNYHVGLNSSERVRKIRSITSKNRWEKLRCKKDYTRNMTVVFDEYIWEMIENAIKEGKVYSQNTMVDYINENLIDHLKGVNAYQRFRNNGFVSKFLVKTRINELGYKNINEYLDAIDSKYNLIGHRTLQSNKQSQIAKKYNLRKNMPNNWYLTDSKEKIINAIQKSNKKRFENGEYKKIGDKNKVHFDKFVWDGIRDRILNGDIKISKDLCEYINSEPIINHLIDINESAWIKKNRSLNKKAILSRLKEEYSVSTTREYIEMIKKNHKVKFIEWVGGDDVYCMTVVGQNGEDDRHNFAVRTIASNGMINESGCFVSNCTSDDLFIPTRSENAPTPIDTLPAAQNLTAIDDIKYIQNKVLTALRIPKTFLNFEENAGDGKNLALMDIRFVRVINRIQQAFLMELTKVASIHLYLLGFDDDLTNFNLTMNNPSTQAEQLEIENKQKMISVVRDAVSDPGNGIPVMSLTRALKEIMGWSDKDIKENFEEIRLEKGIAAELEKTAQIIKRTGIFDIVDRMYGEPGAEYQDDQQMGGPDGGMGGGMPGGGGGGGFGGGLDDLGMPGGNDEGDITGQEGAEPTAEMGGAPEGDGNEPTTPEPNKNESTNKKGKLLTEGAINGVQSSERSLLEHYLSMLNKRAENKNKEASGLIERADIYDKSLLINEDFSKMINSLDDAINEENGED